MEFYSNDYPSIIKRKITALTKLLPITQTSTRWNYEFIFFEWINLRIITTYSVYDEF